MSDHSHHTGTLSPEMALLGLLYRQPSHGYDLHRRVLADLGQVWHLSQSQAYTILKRLEAHGDIASEAIAQEKLPARQLLHITAQGRARFETWLDSTSGGSTRAIRMEFITRIYFLKMYHPEKLPAAFERQRAEAARHIARLQKIRAALPEGEIFNRMSLDLRLQQLHSVLAWLDACQLEFTHLPPS